jgi:hypothetical protein
MNNFKHGKQQLEKISKVKLNKTSFLIYIFNESTGEIVYILFSKLKKNSNNQESF